MTIKPMMQIPDYLKLTEQEAKDYLVEQRVERVILTNGTVLFAANRQVEDAQGVHTNVTFPVGSYFDPAGKSGVTHFLEHFLFHGHPGILDDKAQMREFNLRGCRMNAQTRPLKLLVNFETTSAMITDKYGLKPSLTNFLGMIFLPTLSGDKFNEERITILDELQRSFLDYSKQTYLFLMQSLLPEGHPYRISNLGTEESLRSMFIQDIVNQHELISPNGAVLEMFFSGSEEKFKAGLDFAKENWERIGAKLQPLTKIKSSAISPPETGFILEKRLPTRKGRVMVSSFQIRNIIPASLEEYIFNNAMSLLITDGATLLRNKSGYAPKFERYQIRGTENIFYGMQIETETKKMDETLGLFDVAFKEIIGKIISDRQLVVDLIDKEKYRQEETPLLRRDIFDDVVTGYELFGTPINIHKTRQKKLEITPQDIIKMLEDIRDRPTIKVVLGDF